MSSLIFRFLVDSVARMHRFDFVFLGEMGCEEIRTSGSATGSQVYTAEFRRAKRLQLGRQVMFEILHGGRIHRRVRTELLWRFSL